MKIKLSIALFVFGISTMAQSLVSMYSSIDLQKCSQFEQSENASSAECAGPDNIVLKITAGEWTNLFIKYKGRTFETWETLISVGSGTRLGGENQLVEWILDNSSEGQAKAQSLIVRVSGTNPNTLVATTKLLVYGFSPLGICYRGQATSNTSARQLAEQGQCLKTLPVSLPPPPSLANRYQPTNPTKTYEMVNETRKAHVSSVSMHSAQVNADGSGEFEIVAKHCVSSISKQAAAFSNVGAASRIETVNLGGARSTLQTTPLSFTYSMLVPKGVAIADACKQSLTVLKVRCDIKPGYGGAGCNFKVNDNQIIAVESFKNGYNGVLLLPAQ